MEDVFWCKVRYSSLLWLNVGMTVFQFIQCSNAQVVVGNNVTKRNHHSSSGAMKSWVDTSIVLPQGYIHSVELYRHSDNEVVTPLRLQAWYKVPGLLTDYTLLWETRVIIPKLEGHHQINFTESILLPAGSFLGWTYENQRDDISFDFNPGYPLFFRNVGVTSFPVIGDTYKFSSFRYPVKHSIAVIMRLPELTTTPSTTTTYITISTTTVRTSTGDTDVDDDNDVITTETDHQNTQDSSIRESFSWSTTDTTVDSVPQTQIFSNTSFYAIDSDTENNETHSPNATFSGSVHNGSSIPGKPSFEGDVNLNKGSQGFGNYIENPGNNSFEIDISSFNVTVTESTTSTDIFTTQQDNSAQKETHSTHSRDTSGSYASSFDVWNIIELGTTKGYTIRLTPDSDTTSDMTTDVTKSKEGDTTTNGVTSLNTASNNDNNSDVELTTLPSTVNRNIAGTDANVVTTASGSTTTIQITPTINDSTTGHKTPEHYDRSTTPIARVTYDCGNRNPCIRQANLDRRYLYWTYEDPHFFVQCSMWAQCFIMPCPMGMLWDPCDYTCNTPSDAKC